MDCRRHAGVAVEAGWCWTSMRRRLVGTEARSELRRRAVCEGMTRFEIVCPLTDRACRGPLQITDRSSMAGIRLFRTVGYSPYKARGRGQIAAATRKDQVRNRSGAYPATDPKIQFGPSFEDCLTVAWVRG